VVFEGEGFLLTNKRGGGDIVGNFKRELWPARLRRLGKGGGLPVLWGYNPVVLRGKTKSRDWGGFGPERRGAGETTTQGPGRENNKKKNWQFMNSSRGNLHGGGTDDGGPPPAGIPHKNEKGGPATP